VQVLVTIYDSGSILLFSHNLALLNLNCHLSAGPPMGTGLSTDPQEDANARFVSPELHLIRLPFGDGEVWTLNVGISVFDSEMGIGDVRDQGSKGGVREIKARTPRHQNQAVELSLGGNLHCGLDVDSLIILRVSFHSLCE